MKNIAKALEKFHEVMPNIPKSSTNPFFKSKYASLEDILPAIKEPLKKAGLVFTQIPSNIISGEQIVPALSSVIIDIESGERIEHITPLILKSNDPQSHGSAITYMRRYALVAMLGLNTDEDNDGNEPNVEKEVDIDVPPVNRFRGK